MKSDSIVYAVRIKKPLLEKLKLVAKLKRRSVNNMIVIAIENAIENEMKK